MPERPIIVFDVNETLLDLQAIRPVFDWIFSDLLLPTRTLSPVSPAGRVDHVRSDGFH
ncbi:MAG TPA: hypothetical protein VMU95_18255 [Trebonia sp.]|nr:hypothetical protein [Trebonia sp.]